MRNVLSCKVMASDDDSIDLWKIGMNKDLW